MNGLEIVRMDPLAPVGTAGVQKTHSNGKWGTRPDNQGRHLEKSTRFQRGKMARSNYNLCNKCCTTFV